MAVFSRVDDVAGPPNLVTLTTTLSILSTDVSVTSTVRSQTHVLSRRTYIGRTFVDLHQSNVIYNIHRHVTVRPVCVCPYSGYPGVTVETTHACPCDTDVNRTFVCSSGGCYRWTPTTIFYQEQRRVVLSEPT